MGRILVVWVLVSVFASLEMGAFPTECVEIKSGQCIAGTISYPGEMDCYTFEAEAEHTVVIRMGDRVGTYPSDFRDAFELYYGPPNGAKLGEASDYSAAQGSFALTQSGTYTLVCHETTNRSGDYGVSIVLTGYPVEEVAGDSDIRSIANGEVVGARIDLPGDLDAATFEAEAGHTAVIRMGDRVEAYASDFGDALELYAPNGVKLGEAFDYSAAQGSFALTQSGTYTLVCHEGTNRTGDYGVSIVLTGYRVAMKDWDLGAIASGEVVEAKIDLPGDLDAAIFAAIAGDTAVVRMGDRVGAYASDFGDAFELYGPDGVKLGDAFDYTAAEKAFGLLQTGIYTIICHEVSNRTGNFSLSLVLAGANTPDDIDGDGVGNADELTSGTDPFDPSAASVFRIEQVLRSDGGMIVRWNSVGGIVYRVQYCDALESGAFVDIEDSQREEKDVPKGRPDSEEFTDDFGPPQGPPAQGRRFYRVIIDP